MTTLIHIGDLHLRRGARARENKRFAGVLRWLTRRYEQHEKPVLVFTGDITDNGEEEEFARALELLTPVRNAGFEMLIAPGNHDVGPLGNTFYASRQNNFQRRMLGELMGVTSAQTATNKMAELFPFVRDAGDCLLVAVDSCHNEQLLASGVVGEAQLRALDGILSGATKPVVVLVHHHPFLRDRFMSMNDSEAFLSCLNGRVTALLFGHRHVAKLWRDDPRWSIPLIVAAGKTSKASKKRKVFELREVAITSGPPTETLRRFRISFRR